MEKHQFFTYSWHIDEEEEDVTSIRVYGINQNNESICVRVDNFTPYVYIELPDHIKWNAGNAQLVANKIDELLRDQKPLEKRLMMKKKLYGAHLDSNNKRKLFPYLLCSFSNRRDIQSLGYRLRRTINIAGCGAVKLKMHESDADEILQLTCCRKIPTAGWIEFHGKKQTDVDKLTLCDHEFKVKWKHLFPYESTKIAKPKIMGFDIEVNSTNPTTMPKAERPGDKVFQISCVMYYHGDSQENYEKYLLTLGQPDQDIVGEDVLIYMYDTEADLLEGFTKFIRDENPNLIVGYNILGFDIPYMIDRAKFNMCIFNFDQQGFHKFAHAREKTIKWSSSAYKNQEFQFLDAEGRVYVDLLPLVKRDFKFNNYKLKTIAEHFVGETKDPLSAKGIFKCYRIGITKTVKGEYSNKAQRAMGIVGKYCVQDSALVCLLMDKLQTWVGLTEMANTCNVPIFTLYTQGQQIKVYSQLYKYCMYENIVVEKDAYQVTEDERYVGAHVFPPVPGEYSSVVPFDFASLYPTTIIAYNIDYHTWVPDDSDIPDEMCHVLEWEDHIGCLMKGTNVTIGEYSMKIEDLEDYQGNLVAYNEEKQGMSYYQQTNFFNQGVKECLKLTMEDGTTLCCTPDHRILLSNNTWVEAKDMRIGQDRVSTAYSPPLFDIKDEELVIGDFHFVGSRLIKFYKILGLLCSDGHITNGTTQLYCGHSIDLENIIKDIEDLQKGSYSIRNVNYGYSVAIIGELGKMFRNLDGILWGAKVDQTRTLPILLEQASQGELCAFLSGLFGGDGHTFSYSEKAQSLGTIAFSWTSRQPEQLTSVFSQLQKYLSVCGIRSTTNRMKEQTYLYIKTEDILKFKECIGFSYCIHKSMRLEAGYSYLKLRDEVWKQQKWLVSRVKTLKNAMTIEQATLQAVGELHIEFPVYNEYYASPSETQMKELLRSLKKWEKPMFSYKYFPTVPEYMESIGASNLFESYAVDIDNNVIPRIYKKVIKIENIGKQQVYDLEVDISHSFVADGVVVHNCAHDPKVIRKAELTKYIESEREKIKKLREKRDKLTDKLRKKEIVSEINQKLEDLKPYTKERSEINKTKPKFPMCSKRYYRFLKEPRGVLPTIIENLLDARKHTRKVDMVSVKKKINELEKDTQENNIDHSKEIEELNGLIGVLDKRQLAYKVSANSMYGAMGVRRGYLPFMPGAMCTTYMGRVNIELTAKTIVDKFKGQLVYGDTDSNYINFPHMKDKSDEELWAYSEYVADEVTKLFPPPMKLEFEGEIYTFFFILTKKRYMYRKVVQKEGKMVYSNNIGKKGVLLARRDNSKFVRDVYEGVINRIADGISRDDLLYWVIQQIDLMFANGKPHTDFVITKSVGSYGGLQASEFVNEKGQKKAKVGDYTTPILASNKSEREEQMAKKGASTVQDFYLLCLPAQVQLAERMRKRGQRVDAGSRLEYVVTDPVKHTAKQYEKVESSEYYKKYSDVIQIDYYYYLKALANPLDQVLNVAYGSDKDWQEDFVLKQYQHRWKVKQKCLDELKDLFRPKLSFN